MSKSTISTFQLFEMFPDAEAARMSRQRYISRADLAAQNGALSEELYQLKLLLAGGEAAGQ